MPEFEHTPSRTVVVTGGSSGVGAALCRMAARSGWRVWIGYAKGRDRAQALTQELQGAGCDVSTVALPLDNAEWLRDGAAQIAEQGPAPEALVLCGGRAPDTASLLKLTPNDFRRQLECAVVGHHTLLTELWRNCFRPRGGGHVVGVLSAALGPPVTAHMASYVTAKAGLQALLNAAIAEWGAAGLRVSVIRPGFIDTPMLCAFAPLLLQRAIAASETRRLLTPDEVAFALMRRLENPPRQGVVSEISLQLRKAS